MARNGHRDATRLNDPFGIAGRIVHIALTAVLVALFLGVFQLNYDPTMYGDKTYMEFFRHYGNADQYADLADALLQGRLSLDLPVSDALAQLEDPYNAQDRIAAGSEDDPIYWDHAYYQGSYYSYFGVIPAVLVYVPFRLLTGTRLPTPYAVAFVGVLAIVAASMLVRRVGARYFRQTATTASLAVCLLALFAGCNFTYLAFVPRFYSVPIASSLFFTALGLWFWMGAARSADGAAYVEGKGEGASRLSKGMLVAGSFCMACNLGCRPQFILASFFAFAVFRRELFTSRQLFSKTGIGNTAAALAPYVVVAAPLLAYNYARFGSPFDFGSSYNLTGFNMTTYVQARRLTAVLFLIYLFQPLSFTGAFPFIGTTVVEFPDLGWAPNEPFLGGFFLLKPIMIGALLSPLLRSELRERGLGLFCVMCAVLAVVVLFIDVRVAGITQRYFSDFGLYVALATALALLSAQARFEKGVCGSRLAWRRACIALVCVALVLTFAFDGLSLFVPNRYDAIILCNPDLYNAVASLFG